jgi:ribosome biogenesis GTPase
VTNYIVQFLLRKIAYKFVPHGITPNLFIIPLDYTINIFGINTKNFPEFCEQNKNLKGLVYKSTGSWYQVKVADGTIYNARMKGVIKLEERSSTNPIAVGDWVDMELEDESSNNAIIHHIYERSNYINRQSPSNKHAHHIIASNLDQCLLFATLKDPRTSLGFVDRFLVTAESFHIPSILVYNKADKYGKKEMAQYENIKKIYAAIGYTVLLVSLQTKQGLAALQEILNNKTTLISGHSGVGKSTFINYILPDNELRTQDVSSWSGKGLHTTTFAEMFELPQGGKIIDTPGIRELGLVDFEKTTLSHYFPEMKATLNQCQYNDCLHYKEKICGVKNGVNKGTISEERYISYLTLLDGLDEKKY